MIEVDDGEKVINAVYLMAIRAPMGDGTSNINKDVGKRGIDAIPYLHAAPYCPGIYGSIGLMISLNRSEKSNGCED